MMPFMDANALSGAGTAGRDPRPIVEHVVDRSRRWELPEFMPMGSAGALRVDGGHTLYRLVYEFGTSANVIDRRGTVPAGPTAAATTDDARTTTRRLVQRMSPAEQASEVMCALNLNKTRFAQVLGVSRPTLYEWLSGAKPGAAGAERLQALTKLIIGAGVTAMTSLSPRFVCSPLNEAEPSLLELLKAETFDEALITKVLVEAKALEDEAQRAQRAHEDRLRALGFEEPTEEQRKANLALNIALLPWPKD